MFFRFLLTAALLTGMASVAAAQRGGGGPRGGEGAGDTPPPSLPYRESRLERFSDMLRLTKPQKSMMKDIFDAAQKEADPLKAQIQKSRSDIATAIISKKSQQEIDPLLTQYGTLMAQMAGIELRALGQVVDTLMPDQQKRVGPVYAQMSGMFNGKNWNSTGF